MVWCLMVWLLPHQMKRYHSTRLDSHSCVHLLLFVVHMHRCVFLLFLHTPLIQWQEWNENPVINTSTIPLHGVYCGIFHSLFLSLSLTISFSPFSRLIIVLVHHQLRPADPKDSIQIRWWFVKFGWPSSSSPFCCVSCSSSFFVFFSIFCVVQELHSISCLLFSFQVSESKRQRNTKKVCRTFFDLICN